MKHSYYPIKQLIKTANTLYKIENKERKKEKMPTNDSKLKQVIRDELDNVMKLLLSSGGDKIVLTKWLQSLQRINDICKERNRY